MARTGQLAARLALVAAAAVDSFHGVHAYTGVLPVMLGVPRYGASSSPVTAAQSSDGRTTARVSSRRRRSPSPSLSMSLLPDNTVGKELEPIENQDPELYGEVGDTFVKCGKCQACYAIDVEELGRGRILECSVCGNSWFQSVERTLTLSQNFLMKDWSVERTSDAKAKAAAPARFGFDLFVGNIPFSVSEKDLMAIFSNFGKVVSASLAKDDFDESKGFGVVKMESEADGQKAIGALNGMEIQGRNILVKVAASNPGSRGGGRGRGGRGGGGGRYGGNGGY